MGSLAILSVRNGNCPYRKKIYLHRQLSGFSPGPIDIAINIKAVISSKGTTKARLMVVFRDLHQLLSAAGHHHLFALAYGTKLLRKNYIFPGECKQGNERGGFSRLVDASSHVTMQRIGVAGINANVKAQGLSSPAIEYGPRGGHCFVIPTPGDCNGVFKQ